MNLTRLPKKMCLLFRADGNPTPPKPMLKHNSAVLHRQSVGFNSCLNPALNSIGSIKHQQFETGRASNFSVFVGFAGVCPSPTADLCSAVLACVFFFGSCSGLSIARLAVGPGANALGAAGDAGRFGSQGAGAARHADRLSGGVFGCEAKDGSRSF